MNKPKIKEADITKQIRGYLRIKGVFHWKVFQTLGATPGIADILGVLNGGRILAIEIKTPTGKLSEHQESFLRTVSELGGLAFVARSVEDVMKMGI